MSPYSWKGETCTYIICLVRFGTSTMKNEEDAAKQGLDLGWVTASAVRPTRVPPEQNHTWNPTKHSGLCEPFSGVEALRKKHPMGIRGCSQVTNRNTGVRNTRIPDLTGFGLNLNVHSKGFSLHWADGIKIASLKSKIVSQGITFAKLTAITSMRSLYIHTSSFSAPWRASISILQLWWGEDRQCAAAVGLNLHSTRCASRRVLATSRRTVRGASEEFPRPSAPQTHLSNAPSEYQ